MSSRISWIDRMRGIAMFSVVIQHMTNSLPGDYMYHKFIAISNMAVFFFVSGYIVNQTAHIEGIQQAAGFIWKKTKQLIIPMLAWGLVVNHYFFTTDWHPLTVDDLVNEWNRPALWFLLTLFGFMLYYAVYHVFKNKLGGAKYVFWPVAFVLNAILWWLTGDFSSSLNYLPFFAIGVMASEFSMIKLLTNRYLTLFALPVIFLLTSFWSSGGMSVGNFAIKIVVALSVIPIVYYICAEMEWNPYMDRFMTMCGVNSLAIYCVHRYFTIIWLSEYHFVENEFLALLYTSILAIILCYICVFIKKVIRNYTFVNFLLFGSNK